MSQCSCSLALMTEALKLAEVRTLRPRVDQRRLADSEASLLMVEEDDMVSRVVKRR